MSGLPSDLRGLAAEIHADNIRAGWWKQDSETGRTLSRNIGELLALVHSEISEADEGYLDGLMDDKLPHRPMVEVELADTAIRVLDILGFFDHPCEQHGLFAVPGAGGFGTWARLMHRTTTAALERFRKGDPVGGCRELVRLLSVINHAAVEFGFDLSGAITEKRQFNASRADHRPEVRAAAGGKAF